MSVEGGGSGPAFIYQLTSSGTGWNTPNISRSNLSQSTHQIRVGNCSNLPSDLCVQKLWKSNPFAIEFKFTVAVITSQKKFTESINVRRRADKWYRSAFVAAVDWKIDQSWNYIWVTEKWNANMASSGPRSDSFCLSGNCFIWAT